MQKFELTHSQVQLFRDLLIADAEKLKQLSPEANFVLMCKALIERLNSFLANDDESKWRVSAGIEVVRCQDCKFYQGNKVDGFYCKNRNIRRPNGCHPLDYCNEGARKGISKCLKS